MKRSASRATRQRLTRSDGRRCIKTLGEKEATPDERRVLDNVTKRVRMWDEVAPFYPDTEKSPGKTPESRGTESVLNALILSWNDKPGGKLGPDAKLALDHMWSEQLKSGDAKGAWNWLQFHNAPFEGDSQYYGAALAAVAAGSAPAEYRNSPAIQENLKALRGYLSRERHSQKLVDQAGGVVGLGWIAGFAERWRSQRNHRGNDREATGRWWIQPVFADWFVETAGQQCSRNEERWLCDGPGGFRIAPGRGKGWRPRRSSAACSGSNGTRKRPMAAGWLTR